MSAARGEDRSSSNMFEAFFKLFKEKGQQRPHPNLDGRPPSSALGPSVPDSAAPNLSASNVDPSLHDGGVRDAENGDNRVVVNGRNGQPVREISKQRELKRFQPFSLALFAGVLTVVIFSLSSSKLNDHVKYGIAVSFVLIFFLAVLTIAAGYASDMGTEDEAAAAQPVDEDGSFGCNLGATISCVCVSQALLVVYIVDISIIILGSYIHWDKETWDKKTDSERSKLLLKLKNTQIVVALAADIVILMIWVNVWRRPKRFYSSHFNSWIRSACWAVCGRFYAKFSCVSAERAPGSS